MVKKDTIIYFDDEQSILDLAEVHFKENFPGYRICLRKGKRIPIEQLISSVGGIEKIALVCTDGTLIETYKGWELVRELRNSGYKGPAIYTGHCGLEKEDKPLFDVVINKDKWDELIETMKGYLS